MFKYLKKIDLLRKREKRAVIPYVGKAHQVVFNTLTESDLRLINKTLEVIEENLEKLTQIAQETISILIVKSWISRE